MKPIYAKPPLNNRAAFQVRKDYFDVLDTKWHYHAEYEIALIHYPQGKRISGKTVSMFEESDMVFYGPNIPHSWMTLHQESDCNRPNAGLKYHAIVIHFSETCFGESFFSLPEMQAIKAILKLSNHGIVINGISRIKIGIWMEQMLECADAQRVILLLQILTELTQSEELHLLSSAGYWDNLNDNDATRMNNIYNYILNNFTREMTLEEVAYQAHMSPSAFCRYFKSRTKKTLVEFLNELRVNYACQMLEENKYSITQICFEAGFNNTANFNRRFKHLKGLTPQQYRVVIQNTYQNNKGYTES